MNKEAYQKMKDFIELIDKAKDNLDEIYNGKLLVEHVAINCRVILEEVEKLEKTQYIKDNLK